MATTAASDGRGHANKRGGSDARGQHLRDGGGHRGGERRRRDRGAGRKGDNLFQDEKPLFFPFIWVECVGIESCTCPNCKGSRQNCKGSPPKADLGDIL